MPAPSHISPNFDAHIGQVRLEPLGDSQLHPDFHYRSPEGLTPVEDSHFEPAVTVLSMSLQWERLLAQEKRRNRSLMSWVFSLQDQLRQADASYKTLRHQYDRLHPSFLDAQPGWGLQDAQKTPTGPNTPTVPTPSDAAHASASMPPPPPPSAPAPTPKEDGSHGTKRRGENVGGTPKRLLTRNITLTPYDRPLSPKSLFSPETPTAMSF
ncbi:hypothetical protein DL95DRAFT_452085 [Leptodontidium sp. 2 PMI_412]|nr:hypothetical protein DL95DRAFT_452085 [Leptodontidium sp. 2 PMI_412]